jgi:hypothetical protein
MDFFKIKNKYIKIDAVGLIAILLFFIDTISYCQKVTISVPVTSRNDVSIEMINIKEKPLLLRVRNESLIINVFNEDLSNMNEKEVFFEKKNFEIIATSYNDNKLLIFYKYVQKNEQILRSVHFDKNGNKIDSTELYRFSSFSDHNDLKSVQSDDKSKMLIFRKLDTDEIDFLLFDNFNFKIVFRKKIKFKDLNIDNDFKKIAVSDEGQVYVLFQKIPGLFNKNQNKLLLYNIDQETTLTKDLLVDFYFDSFKFVYDNVNDNIVVSGVRSKLFQSKFEGTFFIKLDKNLNIKLLKNSNFSHDLLQHYYSKKNSKAKKYINNIKVKDLILRNDGGFVLLLESVEIITQQSNIEARRLSASYVGSTDNIYGEVIAISFHDDGTEFWNQVISKEQTSTNDRGIYSSFGMMKNPGNLRIIYNDEIKDETQVVMYSLNPLGSLKRLSLFNTEMYELNLMLRESLQISADKILIPSLSNDKIKLVLLDLEKL